LNGNNTPNCRCRLDLDYRKLANKSGPIRDAVKEIKLIDAVTTFLQLRTATSVLDQESRSARATADPENEAFLCTGSKLCRFQKSIDGDVSREYYDPSPLS
jgi:hypothetical protein